MNRMRLELLNIALTTLLAGTSALAQTPAATPSATAATAMSAQTGAVAHARADPSKSLTVTAAGKTASFSVAGLQAMPQKTVTVHNAHRNADETYTGVLLTEVLAKSGAGGAAVGKPLLRSYLKAEGTDSYWVLYSGIEIEAASHLGDVIVATALDGKPLEEDGAFMLVSTEDRKPQRWVRNLSTLTLVQASVTIQEQFGQIDIYVFDQILRGNIEPGMTVLDAGCGYGRNLVHLLREGCTIYACDANPEGVEHVRNLAASLGVSLPVANLQVTAIEHMPFADALAEVVLCNSVLHFARDRSHFRAMLAELWRVLRPGGLLFCRLGSRIGMDFPELRPGIFRLPDGAEWFLVDEPDLLALTGDLNAVLVDPLKTTIVQDYRCMTTWVIRKRRVETARTASLPIRP